ncbi:4Fe-4S dicluster domain-containing protein [candidate division KSB1 bacterium]|nr:4Fe-4S dicluster domain-containing protein [candidate division KSB1 bacterium]
MRAEISTKNIRSEFVQRVEELSGQDLLACYQCGKCSAGCPIVEEMDIIPNQAIRLAQLGLEDEVLNSKTIWLCASCFMCFSRCPKGVDFSKIAEALRMIAMGTEIEHYGPQQVPWEIAAEAPQQALVSAFRKFSL